MADELLPFEFPLGKSRLIYSKDPSVVGQNFQSLKNLRYTGMYPEGIGGMTPINSSAPTTGGTAHSVIRSAFHFRKEGEDTDYEHLLVYAYKATIQNPKIFKHSVDTPSTGDFTTTPIYTLSGSTEDRRGYFSDGANGTVTFCDGKEALLWGGDEYQLGRFINFTTTGGTNKDFTEQLRNSLTGTINRAILTKATTSSTMLFYIGITRPAKGFKCYFDGISTKNNSTGTMAVQYWNSSKWSAVTNLVDGTSSANKPLRVTGTVSFDSTVTVAKPRLIDNIALYWYRVSSSGVATNSHMGKMTVNAPMQPITDIWDGETRDCVSFQLYDTSKYTDYSDIVLDDDYVSGSSQTYVNIGTGGSNNILYCGFLEKQMGIAFHVVDGSENNTTATLTVSYSSNGKNWTAVSGLIDNTSSANKPFRLSGTISWNPPELNQTPAVDFRTNVDTETMLYYYKISFDNSISNPTQVYFIGGIPAPIKIRGYQYPMFAKNRTWLLNNEDGDKNYAICSAQDAPNVYNGDDSAEFYFGDKSELKGGISLYSVLGANIYDVALFFKRNALFGVTGGDPESFAKYEISINDGLAASGTLKRAMSLIGNAPTNIVIWQGAKGIYMFDNRSIVPIHDDVKNFFNPRESSNTKKLHSDYIENSVGFVDEENHEYHWCFADASSTGNLNREFVFDLLRGFWYEVDRGSSAELQFGINTVDTGSNRYIYGIRRNGIMNRLENGNHFNSNAIDHEYWIGDFAPDAGKVMSVTSLRKLKTVSKSTTATASNIIVRHYIDCSPTASSSFTLSPVRSGYRVTRAKKSLEGQPSGIFHSIRMNVSTTNEPVGYTPIYLGGHFQRVREDL